MQDPVKADTVRHLCIPAGAVATATLAVFVLLLPASFRSTFYRYESYATQLSKRWDELIDDPMDADSAHAHMCERVPHAVVGWIGDRARDWLHDGVSRWKVQRPKWLTDDWIEGLPPQLAHVLAEGGLSVPLESGALVV
jgi:hypothetical protein